MILTVTAIQTTEHEEKDTEFKIILKGNDASGGEIVLTLKDTSKKDLEKCMPLHVGEQWQLELGLVNRTLDEFKENR